MLRRKSSLTIHATMRSAVAAAVAASAVGIGSSREGSGSATLIIALAPPRLSRRK